MTVSVVHATMEDIEAKVDKAVELIGHQPKKDAIFIKPNVPNAGLAGQGLFTDPKVVKALLKCFPGREIVVGEWCFVGCDALRAFQRSGYAELAEEYRPLTTNPDCVILLSVKVGTIRDGAHAHIRDRLRKGWKPKGGGLWLTQNKPPALSLGVDKEVKNGKALVEVL